MKLTNNYNLPEPLYKAIANDTYERRGWISTTQLIAAPQIRYLRKKHWKDIEEDAIDLVWALFGQATHSIIERASEGNDNYEAEVKLEMEVLGKVLSGTADLYDKKNKTLYDFKVTSVWALTLNDDHWEWEAQTNAYAHMLRAIGKPVEKISIVAILKDWKQSEADKNYALFLAESITAKVSGFAHRSLSVHSGTFPFIASICNDILFSR